MSMSRKFACGGTSVFVLIFFAQISKTSHVFLPPSLPPSLSPSYLVLLPPPPLHHPRRLRLCLVPPLLPPISHTQPTLPSFPPSLPSLSSSAPASSSSASPP